MAVAERHTFQILTKRPGRMRSMLTSDGFWESVKSIVGEYGSSSAAETVIDAHVLPNVWIGVSVETQKWARPRLTNLLATPASVRFVSCEPLLGSLDLWPWLDSLDWIIAGGESGARARPMHPDWARSLRDQCVQADVPFFFKQWGQFAPESACVWVDSDGAPRGAIAVIDPRGRSWTRTPLIAPADAIRMRRVGKGRAGRMLDDRTWNEFPVVVEGKAG